MHTLLVLLPAVALPAITWNPAGQAGLAEAGVTCHCLDSWL